jgi:acyl-coenzyme A thioesterase PaaI-like protein
VADDEGPTRIALPVRREAVAELGEALRELRDATVLTEVDDDELRAAAAAARELAARLRAVQREPGRFPTVDAPGVLPVYNPIYGPGSPVAPMIVPGRDEQGRATGRVTVGQAFEGHPGLVHGGWIATFFDVVCVHATTAVDGRAGLTGTLTVRYRRPTRTGIPLLFTAEAVETQERRTTVRGWMVEENDPGTVLAEAEALFVVPRPR